MAERARPQVVGGDCQQDGHTCVPLPSPSVASVSVVHLARSACHLSHTMKMRYGLLCGLVSMSAAVGPETQRRFEAMDKDKNGRLSYEVGVSERCHDC